MKIPTRVLSLVVVLSFTTALTGCGGAGGINLQTSKANPPSPEGSGIENPDTLNTTLGTPIAKDLSSVVINKQIVTFPEELGNRFIQLRSMGGTSSVGAFYGSGVGNKALLGIGGDSFAGKPVADFQSIKFKTRELATNPAGSFNIYVNILVDLNCNIHNPDYALVVSDVTSTPGAKGNWYSFQVNANDASFQSVGGKGGLPPMFGIHAPFTDLVTAYPGACFVAADVFDNGMKRDQKLSPFLLVHGDSSYSKASAVQIDDIELTVGSQTLNFSF